MKRMRERNRALTNKTEVYHKLQKYTWSILETGIYCDACCGLYEDMKEQELDSAGMQGFLKRLGDYIASGRFAGMCKTAFALRKELQSFHLTLIYENDRIVVTEEKQAGAYDDFLSRAFGKHNSELKSPFSKSLDLTNLEQEIIEIFQKKHPEFYKKAKAFYDTYEEYAQEWLLRFAEEIPFYLSFRSFEKGMQSMGFVFAAPSVEEGKEMSARGLYDLALACVNSKQDKEVVSNDLDYHSDERFFVVTGPNQGGKTTFARSLGQLVYFGKLGLDVPALSANVHNFSNILTHFSVEESLETGRGKLKEELVRLKPMMHELSENAFVVINELFTTAASYDACIMGKKVLKHFIDQNCRGIYVTHLKELAEDAPGVVSMRAMLDERQIQNYKIIRKKAEDTASAMNQVNKYRLTYEQLKERLG